MYFLCLFGFLSITKFGGLEHGSFLCYLKEGLIFYVIFYLNK